MALCVLLSSLTSLFSTLSFAISFSPPSLLTHQKTKPLHAHNSRTYTCFSEKNHQWKFITLFYILIFSVHICEQRIFLNSSSFSLENPFKWPEIRLIKTMHADFSQICSCWLSSWSAFPSMSPANPPKAREPRAIRPVQRWSPSLSLTASPILVRSSKLTSKNSSAFASRTRKLVSISSSTTYGLHSCCTDWYIWEKNHFCHQYLADETFLPLFQNVVLFCR